MRSRFIGTTVLLCFIAAGAAIFLPARQEVRATDAPQRAVRSLVAPGITEGASGVVALGFRTAGTVEEILVDTGSKVKKGDILARLDDRLAKVRVEQAQIALLLARARRNSAVAGSRAPERDMVEAALNEAEVEAAERARELARGEQLMQSQAIGSAEHERLRAAAEGAKARASSALAHVSLVKEGPRAEVRREAEAQLQLAEVSVREAETLLADTLLRAPSEGTVLRREVELGEQASTMPPTIAVTLADLSTVRIRAEVDEQDIGLVKVGQRGFASAPAFGGREFAGRVSRIMMDLGRKRGLLDDPHARSDTRVLEVLFDLDGAPSLPVGLRMDLHLPAGE